MGEGVGWTLPHDTLAAYCEKYQVAELALFGSAARGEARADSDFDLLVTFRPGVSVGLLTLSRMRYELEDLVGRPVDLVPRAGLKALIRDTILAEATTLYAA